MNAYVVLSDLDALLDVCRDAEAVEKYMKAEGMRLQFAGDDYERWRSRNGDRSLDLIVVKKEVRT